MLLVDAMRRAAVCLDPKKPYVKLQDGYLTSYSGTAWAQCEVPDYPPFCVRHDVLQQALTGKDWSIEPFGDHGLSVKAGKRRVRIHGISPLTIPDPKHDDVLVHLTLPEALREILAVLLGYIDTEKGAYWMQGVHLTRTCLFAVNHHEAVRFDLTLDVPHLITLPVWLVRSILQSRNAAARRLFERDSTIEILFDDGSQLMSMKLNDVVPDGAVKFVTDVVSPSAEVPLDLQRIVGELGEYKARQCLIGQGTISTVPEENDHLEVEDEIAIGGAVRKWNIANLAKALQWAETIDLVDGKNATWSGAGYTGIFTAMYL